tara:strand:+ start:1341 stop:2132 length:792 start_codon:yes stop_codon:yes gene_type:complete
MAAKQSIYLLGLFRLGISLPLCLLFLNSCAQILGGKAEISKKIDWHLNVETIRYLPESRRPYDKLVQLKDLVISSAYNRYPIISSPNPYQVEESPNHRWAQRPAEMITNLIANYLQDAQLFSQLVRERELLDTRPNFILKGEIKAIERIDSGDIWYAHLVMTLTLEDMDQGKVIWKGEITGKDDIEVYDADMQQTVISMSELLGRKMERFIREIDLIFLRDIDPTLQLPENGNSRGDSTRTGTTNAVREIPSHYELIPGKIAR